MAADTFLEGKDLVSMTLFAKILREKFGVFANSSCLLMKNNSAQL